MSLSNSLSLYVQVLAQNHPPADISRPQEGETALPCRREEAPHHPHDDSDASDFSGINGFSHRWIHLWAKTCFCLRCTGVDCLGWSGMTFSIFCRGRCQLWTVAPKESELTHQVLVDTLVQLPLVWAALPQLLVVVFEALPVRAELLETGFVDVLEAGGTSVSVGSPVKLNPIAIDPPHLPSSIPGLQVEGHVHTPGASGNPPTLLHALKLAAARVLGLALHVVVIVVLASRANEEGSREERSRAGTDLLDLRDRVW